MESIPEVQGRRLSEAGVRRGSDTSVVLTEDTDSFIIGDHVWVGGTKPGQIAYIGETQFAPGDWAGIVLDDPIGKNDGSVAGCRYFQCEPKRGIFSRLTRLTKQPMSGGGAGSPSTPTESVKGSLNKSMSPSLNASTTSLASTATTTATTTTTQQRDLQLGERVIVSSGQGSKTGVLRYIGATEFAAGEWCGVELDEPLGKNDGSVGDKRYFECRPKHGLFAPSAKVSRSPSSRRSTLTGARAAGRPPLAGSTMTRSTISNATTSGSLARSKAGSRESLASMSSMVSAISRATTTASTATATGARLQRAGLMRTSTPVRKTPQETLKDNQKEIEKLRKERDLERDRVTKAASQADEAERTVLVLKKEYEKYRGDCEKAAQETQNTLAKLLEERNLFSAQLEEERRKCEDLLFRFEEESIHKDDIQVANTIHENKIKDLEKQLSEERERVIQLERDSTKLFEVEEELTKLKIELQNSSSGEKSEFDDLEKRNQDLEKARVQLENLLQDKNKILTEYTKEIDEINKRLNEQEQEKNCHEEYKSNLLKQLEDVTKQLQEKCKYIDELQNSFKAQTEDLHKEIEQLKEKIQNDAENNAAEKMKLIEEHERILQGKEEIIKSKSSELKIESQKLFATQEGVLEQLKEENTRQIKELSESFKSQLSAKDTQIEEISRQLEEKVLNLNRLSIELGEFKNTCTSKENEIKNFTTDLEELNIKVKEFDDKNCFLNKEIDRLKSQNEEEIQIAMEQKSKLEDQVSSLSAEIDSLKDQLKNLDECLKMKDLELSKIYNSKADELESLKKQFEEKLENKTKSIQEATADASEKSSRLLILEKELTDLKSVVASKDEEIKNLSEKTSELRDALTLSEQTKTNLESELRMFETNFAELNQKFERSEEKVNHITSQKEKLEEEISTIVSTSMDSSTQLIKYNEDLRQKEKELDEMRDKEFNLQKLISAAESKSNTIQEDLNKANLLVDQFKLENEEVKIQLASSNQELQILSEKITVNQTAEQELIKNNKTLEESLKMQSYELSDLRNSIISYENKNLQLEKDLNNSLEQYKKEKEQFEKQVSEGESDQIALKENITSLEELNKQLLIDQQRMEASVADLKEKLTDKNQYLLELESLIKNKDAQINEGLTNLESIKLEKEQLKKNSLDTSAKYNDVLTEMTLLKSSNSGLETQMSLEVANLKQQLEDEKNTLDTALKESKNQLDELKKDLATVSENEIKSSQKCSEMEALVAEKEKEIQVLNKDFDSEKQKNEALRENIKLLNNGIEKRDEDIVSHFGLIESLKEQISTAESSVSVLKNDLENREKLVAELQNQIENMKQLSIDSADSSDRKRQQDIDELKKKHEQDLISKDEIITEIKNVVDIKEKMVEDYKTKQKSANELIKKYEEELNLTMQTVTDLKTENETIKKTDQDYENTKAVVDELTLKHENEIKLKDEFISDLKVAEKEVNERIQNFVDQINFANERSSHLEETLKQRENDYKQLQINYNQAMEKLNTMKENIKNSTNNDLSNHKVVNVKTEENSISTISGSNSELKQWKEEYDIAKGQIEFLNSVIVDMQRKNEALLCKVEVLEMGIPAQEADDYNLNLIEKKSQPCRMFCDICDQFDLHETDDCPRQAQDADPLPRPNSSEKKIPQQRPYCENCEIFGHDTLACEDTETY